MASWSELQTFFAPRSAGVRCAEGPPLRVEGGDLVMPSAWPVLGLAWSPDGRRVAAAAGGRILGADGTVRVAEPDTGRTLLLRGHGRGTHAVAFDPTTGWLASAGHDGVVGLWDLQEGLGFPIRGTLARHRLAFTGDAPWLLVGDELPPPGGSARVTVLDLGSPAVVREHVMPPDFIVQGLVLDPRAQRIAVHLYHAGGGQRFEVRTFPAWELLWESEFAGEAYLNGLAWPAEGTLLVSESGPRRVRRLLLLDADNGLVEHERFAGETLVGATDVDVARGRIATVGSDGVLGLWNLADLEPLASIPLGNWPGASVALSPDGSRVALGSASEGGVRILSLP